ncbi:MAG: Coenzyme PQQ synthesis protein D [Verrucomicrobia bacterium ADurb.Bin345]|nr:MAG: Coenzyme PQQ synthesis protein D [Verrucomicrobia bacterium ADurb.Bin345]
MAVSYKQRADLVARNIAGETIVVPIRGKLVDLQKIFALNGSAEHLWKQLESACTMEQLCSGLAEEFDVDRSQAETDVREFVEALLEAGLVEGN